MKLQIEIDSIVLNKDIREQTKRYPNSGIYLLSSEENSIAEQLAVVSKNEGYCLLFDLTNELRASLKVVTDEPANEFNLEESVPMVTEEFFIKVITAISKANA